jgi:hypothetical protein
MSEAEVRHELARRLRNTGWVTFQFSVARRVEKQLRNWPDIAAFKDDHALLIEAKRPGGELSPSQSELAERLYPHCGAHVRYLVCYMPDDVDGWLEPGRGAWLPVDS